MNTDSLRLLHLSDIHFKKLDFDIDSDLRDQLEKDAKLLEQKEDRGIQGVIVSGDIAFSGKLDEYEIALDWLETLCRQVNCPAGNVWTVPGNHDVDRQKIDSSKFLRAFHQDIRSASPETQDSLLEEYYSDTSVRELMYESIQNYVRGFASKFNCELNVEHPFVEELNLKLNDGSTLKIRGVNSTLLSDMHDAEKKMIVGSRQSIISDEDGVEHLLVCHHPYSWLMDEEDRRQHWLARARIHLFGHKHNQHLERVNDSLVMTAGAMHPSRREPNWLPRYNLLEIRVTKDVGKRHLEVKVYPRIWSKDDQAFQPEFSKEGDEYKEYKEYKLPIPDWVGEESMKDNRESATEVVAKPIAAESAKSQISSTEPVSIVLDPARQLTYRFLRLPFHKRINIVNKLELLQDEDEGLHEGALFQKLFRRAKETNKLGSLWEEVEFAYGNEKLEENPYRTSAGEKR